VVKLKKKLPSLTIKREPLKSLETKMPLEKRWELGGKTRGGTEKSLTGGLSPGKRTNGHRGKPCSKPRKKNHHSTRERGLPERMIEIYTARGVPARKKTPVEKKKHNIVKTRAY